MSAHTPGPWKVRLRGHFDADGAPIVGVWIEAGEYTSIANLIPTKDVGRNASLIAAAPDLLEACKEMRASDKWAPGEHIARWDAAIAKAEGKR